MAFDQYCLEGLPLEEPLFYLWRNSPAVIVGMNQNVYKEVNLPYLEANHIALVRRVTGGGAVYHDLKNLNYTIVGKSDDLERDFPGYLHLIIDALKTLGVNAELSGRNDILIDGKKVSGYAKRVYRDRLMVHGTLMFDVDINRLTQALNVQGSKLESKGVASVRSKVANLKDYLPNIRTIEQLQTELHQILAGTPQDKELYKDHYKDQELILSSEQLQAIQTLADTQFNTWAWNYGRSPKHTYQKKQKYPCGTIEVNLQVEKGIITSLQFTGDFLGNLPADTLAAALIGCRYERTAIINLLDNKNIDRYFDHLQLSDLLDLLTNPEE